MLIFKILKNKKILEFQGLNYIWSDNKGYSKLLIVKVDKQLITKIIITYFSKILNRFKEF